MVMDPPTRARGPGIFGSWMGFVLAAAAAVVALWFLQKIVGAILLLFFALVVAIALSAPVAWFVRRGLSRRWAALLTLILFFAAIGLVGWLVIPQLAGQIVLLVNQLPDFLARIDRQFVSLLERYPDLQRVFAGDGGASAAVVPDTDVVLRGLERLLAVAARRARAHHHLLLDRRLCRARSQADPPRLSRQPAARLSCRAGMRAYRRAARAVIGWTKASLVIGAIQAVAAFVFLTIMEVPGALVWAALAFFADFIPRIGGYVMAFPPVVLSLSLGPMTAVWVALFYLASTEILGSVVAPKIRGATMQLHPVLLIFFTLAFALAFGLLGAIVATPAAAFFSAFYSEFYLKRPLRRDERA